MSKVYHYLAGEGINRYLSLEVSPTRLEENLMANALEMQDDGTSIEVCVSRNNLTSDSVLCVLDDEGKNVFLWLGKEAPARKRFVGAQTASKIREEQGTGFRVRSLDEGHEPDQFFNSLERNI